MKAITNIEQLSKLQKFSNRILLLQKCVEQARESILNSPTVFFNDSSYTTPSFLIDGAERNIESIQEELRFLSYIQPYL